MIDIDPDAQQAYIDGLGEKCEKDLLAFPEAMAIVCGRAATVLMQNFDELTQMQNVEENGIIKSNCALLAKITEGMVQGFQARIQGVMDAARLVQPCSSFKPNGKVHG